MNSQNQRLQPISIIWYGDRGNSGVSIMISPEDDLLRMSASCLDLRPDLHSIVILSSAEVCGVAESPMIGLGRVHNVTFCGCAQYMLYVGT